MTAEGLWPDADRARLAMTMVCMAMAWTTSGRSSSISRASPLRTRSSVVALSDPRWKSNSRVRPPIFASSWNRPEERVATTTSPPRDDNSCNNGTKWESANQSSAMTTRILPRRAPALGPSLRAAVSLSPIVAVLAACC